MQKYISFAKAMFAQPSFLQIYIKPGDYRPVYIKIKTAVLSLLASGRRLSARRNSFMFKGLGVPKYVMPMRHSMRS